MTYGVKPSSTQATKTEMSNTEFLYEKFIYLSNTSNKNFNEN